MSLRSVLSLVLIGAALAFGPAARAEEPKTASSGPEADESAQSCAHHMKAMHAMSTDKQREAYCHAHKDCVSHDCGGMGAREHGTGPVDPPGPKPPAPKK